MTDELKSLSNEIIRMEGLTKVYNTGEISVTALNCIDLTVRKGEFIAIMGASGSGKSTLLHLIGGVDKPTAGKVVVDDTDIGTLNQTELAIFRRRKVGLIYQFYNLIPTLTVRRNIMLPMLLDKKKPEQEFFDRVVKALKIQDKLEALPSQLSGGEQQRTAIARSLLYHPALLLADEPTGNLDKKNSREVIELFKLANQDFGQTVILVTHDETIAQKADRIIHIEDGKIISDEKKE